MKNGRGPDRRERKRRDDRRELSSERLVEIYRGKKALEQEWDLHPDIDHDYHLGLKRRVRKLEHRVNVRSGFAEADITNNN